MLASHPETALEEEVSLAVLTLITLTPVFVLTTLCDMTPVFVLTTLCDMTPVFVLTTL